MEKNMFGKLKVALVGFVCSPGIYEASASEFLGPRIGSRMVSMLATTVLPASTLHFQSSFDFSQRRFAATEAGESDGNLFRLMAPSFEKIDGNYLREIAANGSPDFIAKSYRLIEVLKISFKDESPVEGKDGLSDAEADWKAAWEDLALTKQKTLANAYEKIGYLVEDADRIFYGIETKEHPY